MFFIPFLTLLGPTYFYNVKTPPRKWPLRLPEVVFEAGNQMHRIYEEISAPEMTGNGPEMDRKWVGNGEIERL